MDIAFASRVTSTHTIIQNAVAAGQAPFQAGDAFPVDDGYCKRVLDGRIPALIHEGAAVPEVANLACTREMPIGSHLSVPLRLSDGSLYGTFCCFSSRSDYSLNERDVEMMRAFADLAAGQIEAGLTHSAREAETVERVSRAIERDNVAIAYQPIYEFSSNEVIGVEALARFPDSEGRGPDDWFAEAAAVGLGIDLELAAVRAAVRGLKHLPPEVYLAINVSPEVLLSGRLTSIMEEIPPGRIVLEVTEHAIIRDFVEFRQALAPLRGRVRIAIDDAGAGYSGLRHILDIRPDIIKLDMSLTRGIDKDPARTALGSALITFAAQIGSTIVAEGIETAAEYITLKCLGAHAGQGYHLQRPKPISALLSFLTARKLGLAEVAETSGEPMARKLSEQRTG
jgi:EAL domain-containing protein (putative c-di-GMP-specific phosphodiesterase class I)